MPIEADGAHMGASLAMMGLANQLDGGEEEQEKTIKAWAKFTFGIIKQGARVTHIPGRVE
jgi:hypothetical protein